MVTWLIILRLHIDKKTNKIKLGYNKIQGITRYIFHKYLPVCENKIIKIIYIYFSLNVCESIRTRYN